MIPMRRYSKKTQARQTVPYLLCDASVPLELKSEGEQWLFRSPIQCLDRAIDGNSDFIAVRFGSMPIRTRETMVELCAALKRNSHTRKKTVLALLHGKHRGLMEILERAGVDFVKYISEAPLSSTLVIEIIDALGPDDRVESRLASLCPNLHYDVIDAEHEISLCGAALDRMVLGGKRLHEVCETQDHSRCKYFLNPRLKS